MARLTSFGLRLSRFVSRLGSEARAKWGRPDPSALGPWAEATIDTTSGLLSVTVEAADITRVRLRHGVGSLTAPLAQVDATMHQLRLGAMERYGTLTPLRIGTWHVEARTLDGWKPLLGRKSETGTVVDVAGAVKYRLVSAPEGLQVRSTSRLHVTQRLAPAQRLRAALLPLQAATRPVEHAVIYECFWGRQVGDNPLAMVEPIRERFPGIKEYWVISPGRAYAPAGTTPVARSSPEWYTVLASVEFVVTNAALPDHFRRRDGQTVLQTWHGTPLKRLGLDMLSFEHMSHGYADSLRQQAAQWSLLVAPSPMCAEVYPKAFDYAGQMLEVGSPRNDVLVNGADQAVVVSVRGKLGLKDGQRVVLVAPTFRDGQHTRVGLEATGHIDLDALCEALGDGITVLFRAHNWIDTAATPVDRTNLVNVSDYPDIAELYLVTDLLVTDYSSVMFDFAVTGRPMVFHAPDLEQYRDELRGWYFDLEAEAPGPITRNGEELASAVAESLAHGTPSSHLGRYQAFRERFSAWERGDAAVRVADALLEGVQSQRRR
jgi:CDP-glycerol glycerophosphotransferase